MLCAGRSSPGGARAGRPRLTVQEIFRAYGEAYRRSHALSEPQRKAMRAIEVCRTPVLGGRVQVCDRCDHTEVVYHSCRNRHCPLCQCLSQAKWIEGRMERLLPSYLGRYTHRVGLSNQRLLGLTDEGVHFRTRGKATATLSPDDFIHRFLQHVLPDRFVKIRHYGLTLSLEYEFRQAAFDRLKSDVLGRIVLVTDRDDWTTAEIIDAYHGQSRLEAVFAHLKDPMHLALRPQFHWTDQKLHVHVLTCILGYLLAQCVFLRAQRAGAPYASMESLLDALERVRRATVARSVNGRSRVRLTTQLEEIDPQLGAILPSLGIGA